MNINDGAVCNIDTLKGHFNVYDHPALSARFVHSTPNGTHEASLAIHGIRCAGCITNVERALLRTKGVISAQVNYVTHQARIVFTPPCKSSDLFEAVERAGLSALPYDPSENQARLVNARKTALRRIAVAAALGMQVMVIAVALYGGDYWGMEELHRRFLRWTALLLTAGILAYSARPFYAGAYAGLKRGRVGMDVPIVLGLSLAFAASAWACIFATKDVYFDSIAMFVLLVLSARYFELAGRLNASIAHDRALPLVPTNATRLNGGQHQEAVPTLLLAPGDKILVRTGETIPADGQITQGQSTLNEALLSGESLPTSRGPGDDVVAGAINMEGPLVIKVRKTGENTAVSALERMLHHARAQRAPHILAVDRIAGWFSLAVITLGFCVAAYWLQSDPSRWLDATIAVLIVTCPCALSLATPAAFVACRARALADGLVVARGEALDMMNQVTHVVFDKTGTLTLGKFALSNVTLLSDVPRDECLAIACALEHSSEHPLAKALLRACANMDLATPVLTACTHELGAGVRGTIDGTRYAIGGPKFAATDDDIEITTTDTSTILTRERTALCVFHFNDTLRAQASVLIEALRRRGKQVVLASGDNARVVQSVGAQLGIPDVHAECTPEQKLALVKSLQNNSNIVAMVGDGVNDGPVLGGADVSIAMTDAAHMALANADLVINDAKLLALDHAFEHAAQMARIIKQNFTWAICYNFLCVPAAAAGWIPPWAAAIGMSLSSTVVILNASRLARAPQR